MYMPPLYPINNQFTNDTHDSNGTFVEFIAYDKLPGYPEVQNVLFDDSGSNSQGAMYIANHIRDANQITLAFIDADSTVVAGWVRLWQFLYDGTPQANCYCRCNRSRRELH